MKIDKLKTSEELKAFASEEVRNAASKEELYEVVRTFDKHIASMQLVRNAVFRTLEDKLCKSEQLTLDFGAYTYPAKNEVKKNFLYDFEDVEEEAKFLEDMGFPELVSRTEEVVKKTKIDRAGVKKRYIKNVFPEAVSSRYRFEEKTSLKLGDPVLTPKPATTEEE